MNFRLLWISAVLTFSQAQASDKIQLYFNHNTKTSYTEPYRGITREGDDFEAIIIKEINKATKTIDMAIHDLNVPGISKALIKKHKAGVKVRLVLENKNNIPFSDLSNSTPISLDEKVDDHDATRSKEMMALIDVNGDGKASKAEILDRDSITMLNNAKIPKIDDTYDGSAGSGIMHHKFFVVDGVTVVQASANFTLSDIHGDMLAPKSRGNQNALMVIQDAKMAKVFSDEFVQLWNFKFGPGKTHRAAQSFKVDGTTITVKFSPSTAKVPFEATTNGLIRSTLLKATKSVDLALFVFSEQALADAIYTRHVNKQHKVKVSALVEPSFAYRDYSELLDMLGLDMPNEACAYEKANAPWKKPAENVGIPTLPKGDLLHHKFGVVDTKTVIYGSHNWSEAANTLNDEALLVVDDVTVAKAFKNEHNRLMQDAVLGASDSLLTKIENKHYECDGK